MVWGRCNDDDGDGSGGGYNNGVSDGCKGGVKMMMLVEMTVVTEPYLDGLHCVRHKI